MSKFEKTLKDKFGFDVSALPNYTDEQSERYITDLIQNSTFLAKLTLEEGVKGTRTIKLLNADMSLQTMSGCTPSPDGAVVFTKRNITVKRLYAGIEFCNEDLNTKYTQMLNKLGVNGQDLQMPLEDIILAYLAKLLRRKVQRAVVLGDTTSLDADLANFDGLVKLIDNDADVIEVNYQLTGASTGIDSTNAYAINKAVYDAIPDAVFDDGLNVVLLQGRKEARAIIDYVWNNKDFNAKIETTNEGSQLSFEPPAADIRVETIPELSGTDKIYAFIYDYAFLGVDLEDELDTIAIKTDEYNNKLKAEAMFRVGTQFILPQYWVRLNLLPVS